jgi:hypothetical protein
LNSDPFSCRLAVKVIPGASRNKVCGWLGETLKVKLSAPPVDGRANDALFEFLAEKLGLPRRRKSKHAYPRPFRLQRNNAFAAIRCVAFQ